MNARRLLGENWKLVGEPVEDPGYDAVKARRARRCAEVGDASAEAYDAAHAAGREAARNLDRLLAGNEARCDFIAQQITDAVLRAVWGQRDLPHDNCDCRVPGVDPIAEVVRAGRKLEDDAAVEAAYDAIIWEKGGRFAIARRAALAAVQAVRDLR